MLHRTLAAAVFGLAGAGLLAAPQEPARVAFRSSLDLVSVAVIVRDGGGRLVKGLRAQDFEIVERQTVRQVMHFETARNADARLALLVDSSGSMVVGAAPARTRMAADLLIAGMRTADTTTVFSFDSGVRRLADYTGNRDTLRAAVSSVLPVRDDQPVRRDRLRCRHRSRGRAARPGHRAAHRRHRHGEPALC